VHPWTHPSLREGPACGCPILFLTKLCSSIHGLTPRCARGQPAAVQNRSRRCVFVPSWDSPLAARGASLRLSKIVPDVVCSSLPGTHPSLREGPACGCPKSFQTILSKGGSTLPRKPKQKSPP